MSLNKEIERLINGGAFDKAAQAVESLQDKADALYYKALLAFKRDDFDTAVQLAEQLTAEKETDARGHALLGQALGLKAQHAGAVKGAMLLPKVKKAFSRALELDENNTAALEGLFMVCLFAPSMAGGDEGKAREIMVKTQNIHPARAALMEGIWHSKKQESDKARQAFARAAEAADSDPEVLLRSARFFLEQGALEEAGNAVSRFVNAVPEGAHALELQADLSRARKEWDNAVRQYESLLSERNGYLPARLKLAVCLKEKGDAAAARQHLQSVLDQAGKSPIAGRARELMKSL
ncbi:MAG: hypothetical protein D6677_02775 [Calditrichaeota bacterium]|nr:MAG: hypothetical protein D6677_02775 [Calditrichota bacterium]